MNDDTSVGIDNPVFDYKQTIPDRFNPFDNDTENSNARDDYRKIVPQISMVGCVIPEKPSSFERSNIKRVYSRTGLALLFHLVLSNVLATVVTLVVSLIGIGITSDFNTDVYSGSTSISIVAITYTVANVCSFLLGCKLLHIPIKSVFYKPTVTTLDMAKHISIAWCLQGACMLVVSLIYVAFATMGINLVPDSALSSSDYSSVTYTVATLLYTCVIAPITEEMLFRGVVLKGFSVVSQRFGIFMSALMFGLLHGNVLQSVTTFVVGLYLGFIATKYNSILPTIVMHFFINLAPTLIEIVFVENELVYDAVLYGFYSVMIVLGIVFICLGIRKKSNRLPIQTTSQKKRTLPIAMSSLSVLTVLLLYLITMVLNHASSILFS